MEEYNEDWNLLPDEEVAIDLIIGNKHFEFMPHNTELFRHIGRLAIYDCVYHESDTEDYALYIFHDQPLFEELAETLTENGFPVYMNMREVSKEVKDNYLNMLLKQMWEGIPPEYFEEEK